MQKGGRECPFTYLQFISGGHVLSPAHRERRPVVLTQPEGREGRGAEWWQLMMLYIANASWEVTECGLISRRTRKESRDDNAAYVRAWGSWKEGLWKHLKHAKYFGRQSPAWWHPSQLSFKRKNGCEPNSVCFCYLQWPSFLLCHSTILLSPHYSAPRFLFPSL